MIAFDKNLVSKVLVFEKSGVAKEAIKRLVVRVVC